jgi:hypothetical protein
MPTYKGNVGHLMQHWTLCELLEIAQQQGVPGLNFIDAHAMAPLAREKDPQSKPDKRFNLVAARVQSNHEPNHEWASKYEWAWHHLEPSVGYPSSAAFVRQVWEQNYSLLLCESDGETADEIDRWLRPDEGNLCRGDWRNRFDQRLPTLDDVDLPPGSLTLVSFDPDLISWHPRPDRLDHKQRRAVYSEDLQDVQNQLAGFDGRVTIHLPTYTAQNNAQGAVISSVNSILVAGGFTLAALVMIPKDRQRQGPPILDYRKDMMSMIYARGLDVKWTDQLANLPRCFATWFRDATKARPAGA